MNGWIKLHRQFRESPYYRIGAAVQTWVECLLRASHDDRVVFLKRQRIELKQGQFVMGRDEFGQAIGISGSTAWYWMLQFEADNMIDIKKTTRGSLVTVKNWNEYQKFDNESDNKQTADEQQKNTNKKGKKDKNEKKSLVPSEDDTPQNRNLCETLYQGMLTANEAERTADTTNPKRREQKVSAWVKSVGQLKRIDGATDQQIAFVIKWLFSSGKKNAIFWQKNIRSGATLREKWSQLVANCKEDHQKQGGTLNIPSNDELSNLSL